MSVRRLAKEQPEHFEFTPENQQWAQAQIKRFPEGRQASAVIMILWRAQEQHEGWLPEPAIRLVADMLEMPYIRVLEVATFYTMFQLAPVGKKAHIQVCGTTPCMLRGSDDLLKICKKRIAENPHTLSKDGNFSWEEVECLGACVNAPMIQIFKDTYEDLNAEKFENLLDAIEEGKPVAPGPQNERDFSQPVSGATSLTQIKATGEEGGKPVAKIIEGSEATIKNVAGFALNDNSHDILKSHKTKKKKSSSKESNDIPSLNEQSQKAQQNTAQIKQVKKKEQAKPSLEDDARPQAFKKDEKGAPDDLKRIKGIGPKIEGILNDLGIFYFEQIAGWSEDNKKWVDSYLSFKGRIDRENWIAQAESLYQSATLKR